MAITSLVKLLELVSNSKAAAVDLWKEDLSPIEREFVDESFGWLVDNLEIKKGVPVITEEITLLMAQFTNAIKNILDNNKDYQNKVTGFVRSISTIQKNVGLLHKQINSVDIEKAGATEVQKAIVTNTIDAYLGNGLNEHFASPLKDMVYRNVLAGTNMRQTKELISDYIKSGKDQSGKMGQYMTQTAQQAVDSYTGAVNVKLQQTFKFDGMIISGSLIETSSEQCVEAVESSHNGYLSNKEWEHILEIAADNKRARLIAGTTLTNLPINKLHWGCRHEFTPVFMNETMKKYVSEK